MSATTLKLARPLATDLREKLERVQVVLDELLASGGHATKVVHDLMATIGREPIRVDLGSELFLIMPGNRKLTRARVTECMGSINEEHEFEIALRLVVGHADSLEVEP